MKEFKFHVPVDGILSISICADDVKEALEILRANGEDAYVIGEIIEAEDKIILE